MTKIKKEETKISVITTNCVKQKRIHINLRTLNKIMFFLILIFGFCYITGANSLTAKGFKLRDLKKQFREISNDNASLETKVTDLSSYSDIDAKVKDMKMVAIDKVNYLEIRDGSVAKK